MLVFALVEYAASVTHIEDGADTDERIWILIHALMGPVLLCAWYRPPGDGESDVISRFSSELQRLRAGALGAIVIGDINLRHLAWLTFSSHSSICKTDVQHCERGWNDPACQNTHARPPPP